MSFTNKWKSFKQLCEVREPSPFTSQAQQRYKAQRKRNDIYTSYTGAAAPGKSKPFSGKLQRFGTSRLRFEKLEQISFESFKIHDELEPNIWRYSVMIPEIRDKLIKIAQDFLESLPVQLSYLDIVVTGSLANYNWSKYSDIDLHIIVDMSKMGENLQIMKDYFKALKNNWNNRHDIYIKSYEVEIYVQDASEAHYATGVYSIHNEEWVKEPEKTGDRIDISGAKRKAHSISERIECIEDMISDNEEWDDIFDAISRLKSKIKNMRKSGLEDVGEYSIENLAFKVLRRSHELEKLDALKTRAYDDHMSISEDIIEEGRLSQMLKAAGIPLTLAAASMPTNSQAPTLKKGYDYSQTVKRPRMSDQHLPAGYESLKPDQAGATAWAAMFNKEIVNAPTAGNFLYIPASEIENTDVLPTRLETASEFANTLKHMSTKELRNLVYGPGGTWASEMDKRSSASYIKIDDKMLLPPAWSIAHSIYAKKVNKQIDDLQGVIDRGDKNEINAYLRHFNLSSVEELQAELHRISNSVRL
jgi:predicted nucleotidyltransferase